MQSFVFRRTFPYPHVFPPFAVAQIPKERLQTFSETIFRMFFIVVRKRAKVIYTRQIRLQEQRRKYYIGREISRSHGGQGYGRGVRMHR